MKSSTPHEFHNVSEISSTFGDVPIDVIIAPSNNHATTFNYFRPQCREFCMIPHISRTKTKFGNFRHDKISRIRDERQKSWNGGNSIFDSLNYFETKYAFVTIRWIERDINIDGYWVWRLRKHACCSPRRENNISLKLVFVFHSDIPFSPFESKIHAKSRLFDPKYRYIYGRMFERNEFSFSKLFEIIVSLSLWGAEFTRVVQASTKHTIWVWSRFSMTWASWMVCNGDSRVAIVWNCWSLLQTPNCENIDATFHWHSKGLITR